MHFFDFLLNCIFGFISLFRVCTGRGAIYDYIVIFFTTDILVYDISKIVKSVKKRKEIERSEDGAES